MIWRSILVVERSNRNGVRSREGRRCPRCGVIYVGFRSTELDAQHKCPGDEVPHVGQATQRNDGRVMPSGGCP